MTVSPNACHLHQTIRRVVRFNTRAEVIPRKRSGINELTVPSRYSRNLGRGTAHGTAAVRRNNVEVRATCLLRSGNVHLHRLRFVG